MSAPKEPKPGPARILQHNSAMMYRTAALAALVTVVALYLQFTGKASLEFWLVAGLGWVIVLVMFVLRRRDLENEEN